MSDLLDVLWNLAIEEWENESKNQELFNWLEKSREPTKWKWTAETYTSLHYSFLSNAVIDRYSFYEILARRNEKDTEVFTYFIF